VDLMLRGLSNTALVKWRALYRIEAEEQAAAASDDK
jgi:hypothetical protein